ncbi:hypothetical protein C8R47DRAFT_1156300 [Mycena vitilis]|nr:hypothetical protein C8R47DRAFT_1156300 [Mycena vitilis]
MGSLCPLDTHLQRPADLQKDGVRLCIALQSELNLAFLDAVDKLLSCGNLPPAEFRRHSRKIIRLIETARDRLEAEGISLYLFASCRKGKWKYVYFDLLRMLHARRGDVDVDVGLQARTKALLIRLSSSFVGREMVRTTPALPEKSRQSLEMGITSCTPQPSTASTTMPPPDAFPPRAAQSFLRRMRHRQMLPFLPPELSARPRKRAKRSAEQENKIPSPEMSSATYTFKAPPLTKRFGIFCTGKNSMHRPRSVRAY